MSDMLDIEMPPQAQAPPKPSDVRSESVNYDDKEVKENPPSLIDEVLESAREAIDEEKKKVSFVENPAGDNLDAGADEPSLTVKPLIDDEQIFKDAKPKRKRKPVTDKQREHLARCREKAQAKRKSNQEVKKKETVQKVVKEQDPRPQAPSQESLILHMTRDDLQQFTQNAIEGYDTKRKTRKAKKRAEQEEFQKATLVNRQIAKAVGQPDPDDMWSVCFQ
jgi:hypothetical protein